MKISDLPKPLQDAIYIEDCHVSGSHDPCHTETSICDIQLVEMAKRILAVIGIDLDKDNTKEMNKLPRRIVRPESGSSHYSWYQYYLDNPQYKQEARDLEQWEAKGFLPKGTNKGA